MHDLTMSEVLVDPLIRQLRRADGVGQGALASLLQKAFSHRPRPKFTPLVPEG
jgi:hypothetical protein